MKADEYNNDNIIGRTDKYEKQLKALGVTNKEQRKALLSFMYQVVKIAYGIMEEEQQKEIITNYNSNDNEEKESFKDAI